MHGRGSRAISLAVATPERGKSFSALFFVCISWAWWFPIIGSALRTR